MIRAALRRLAVLVAGSALGIGVLAALVGLALGSSFWRSVSLGYYLTGCFLLIAGFFIGNRGPLRAKRESGGSLFFGPRVVRRATIEEREETINNSAVFVGLGFLLILLGVLADDRYRLL